MDETWLEGVSELLRILEARDDVEMLEVVTSEMQIRVSRADVSSWPILATAPSSPAIRRAPRSDAPGDRLSHDQESRAIESQDRGSSEVQVLPPRMAVEPEELEGCVLVRSPMIGTFYRAPEPGAAPFAVEGESVAPEATLALVESMKVFVAVRAGVPGVVESIFVENAGLVQYDQPVFRIRVS